MVNQVIHSSHKKSNYLVVNADSKQAGHKK